MRVQHPDHLGPSWPLFQRSSNLRSVTNWVPIFNLSDPEQGFDHADTSEASEAGPKSARRSGGHAWSHSSWQRVSPFFRGGDGFFTPNKYVYKRMGLAGSLIANIFPLGGGGQGLLQNQRIFKRLLATLGPRTPSSRF